MDNFTLLYETMAETTSNHITANFECQRRGSLPNVIRKGVLNAYHYQQRGSLKVCPYETEAKTACNKGVWSNEMKLF